MTQNINFQKNIPSGFTKLDEMTAGWRPGDFVIIAGRPSMGKSGFALSAARNMILDSDCGVAFFSLEMPEWLVMKRIVYAETELDRNKIPCTKHEWKQLNSKITELFDAPLYIDDTPALSVSEFREKCLQLIQENNIRVAIIDYLQLMMWRSDKNISRGQQISNISRSLKAIACELNITVIALSQLQKRANRRPVLSDLSDENIAQYADVVTFIHRPEYYCIGKDSEGNTLRGVAEIIIAKNRNGILGDVRLIFKKQFCKFVEPETTIPALTAEIEN